MRSHEVKQSRETTTCGLNVVGAQSPTSIKDVLALAEDALESDNAPSPFDLANKVAAPTDKARLRALVVAPFDRDGTSDFVIGWRNFTNADHDIARQITLAWRIAGNSDPESRTSEPEASRAVIQRVAEYFPRAILATSLLYCTRVTEELTAPLELDFEADKFRNALLSQNWQDIDLIRNPNCQELIPFGPQVVQSLHQYALDLSRRHIEGDPASLLAGAAVVWFDVAMEAIAVRDLQTVSKSLFWASDALSTALYYYGYKLGIHVSEPPHPTGATPDASTAARQLAAISAQSRRSTSEKLVNDFLALGISKNQAAKVLAIKYNLAESTVRDKLKGVQER